MKERGHSTFFLFKISRSREDPKIRSPSCSWTQLENTWSLEWTTARIFTSTRNGKDPRSSPNSRSAFLFFSFFFFLGLSSHVLLSFLSPLCLCQGVVIESIAWNKAKGGDASTREILVGSSKGQIFETAIEPTDEFFKKEDKYFKQVI